MAASKRGKTKEKISKVKKPKTPKNVKIEKTDDIVKSNEENLTVANEPHYSPKEQEKVKDPAVIRLAKGLGRYAGIAVGTIAGGRFGFANQGATLGSKYGTMLAEYGAKKLVETVPILGQFKKGGRVYKTGAYILHKGEKVIPVRRK